MWSLAAKLRQRGVLGINRRNAEYLLPYNPRALYPLVDDKLLTKQLAEKASISVPELYGVVEIERQSRELQNILGDHNEFVIKPANGSGGKGIIVIAGRRKDRFRRPNGMLVGWPELRYHVSNILSGIYSLGGQPDKALIEYRVQFDPVFESISYLGVPDVRIIVFLGVPVMAMVRLPTRSSDGRANLHQGAIGAGVDIASGRTLTAVWYNDIVAEHPDTGNPVQGVQIPHWPRLLELAAQAYELTGLGYQGVDFVIDRDKGPMMLELNARPGLNIQIANGEGLLRRLQVVESNQQNLGSVAERIAFSLDQFAAT